jgi:hypothetical protein
VIRVEPPPEPPGFDADVRKPGEKWLADNPVLESRRRAYWSKYREELADGFKNLCAFTAMYEPVGTVDHFVSVDENPALAYEWGNYRYASGWINSSKQKLESNQLLDPFEIGEDWFEIILPSLQLKVSGTVPAEFMELSEFVVKRLHLGDDERVIRQRRAWYGLYQEGKLNLEGLRDMAPRIAAAVEREQRANTQGEAK